MDTQSVVLSYLFIYLLLLLTGSNLLTDVLTDIAMRRLAKNRSCAKEWELCENRSLRYSPACAHISDKVMVY